MLLVVQKDITEITTFCNVILEFSKMKMMSGLTNGQLRELRR